MQKYTNSTNQIAIFKMSKKSKNKRGKQAPKSKSTQSTSQKKVKTSNLPLTSFFARESTTTSFDTTYRRIFMISFLLMVIFTFFLALQNGINGDDEFQNDYSKKLVNYYTTMGQDKAALNIEKGNMHFYGGFFDLMTGLVNNALDLDDYNAAYHRNRHIFNAFFGIIAFLFIGLIAREIAGWRAGILALFFAFLSPRFLGHALMNPKDIPFAAGFAITLFFMTRLLKQLPKLKWQSGLGIAIGFSLALATRAGGLLIIGYLGLFMVLDFLLRYGTKGLGLHLKQLGSYFIFGFATVAFGYFLAVLSWPAALEAPLSHPIKALTEFAQLGIKIRLLFMGENVMSDNTAWFYPFLWILRTIPLFAIIGFLGSMIFFRRLWTKYVPLPLALLLFSSLFPLLYVIYKDSILHDGWRHLMFIYPSLVVLASLFWVYTEQMLKPNKIATYGLWGILALTMIESTIFIVRNPQYPYVYFNPIGGGIQGAFGNYETDYWGISTKQAIEWMEKEGILYKNMQDTVIIASTFYYNVSRMVNKKYDGYVKTKYVRFNERYSQEWDYGIFPSRFIRAEHLKSGNWPNSKTIHTIKANGVPLTAIEQQKDNNSYLGDQAVKQKNWEKAIEHYSTEVENFPDNELAWLGLTNAFLNLNQNEPAIKSAQKTLEIAPKNESALYFSGLAYLRNGQSNEGVQSLIEVLKVNPEYYIADYYLAVVYQQNKQLDDALRHGLKAIETNAQFKAGYELISSIYLEMGDEQNAARYQQAAAKL